MNEPNLASIKRHLEQLKVRMSLLDNYKGWITVNTENGDRIFEDIGDGELQALIKRKLEDSIKFCQERLKENEDEPKS
ncbi:hypothetical protein ABNB59_19430 [Paenibacillus larvae]|uniref:hypothetical protein n=1 Tax=Paenibacillus larvae TaxID=1464 RepID=UPI0023A9610F|nr:hypothetical protein [Paenibacillus larvae]MDE5167671.1 hypothetical protein [Paenibacillus larvae subsp. larvae]MDV3433808.1 hypothetical protein [Paenibacillus larvae]UYL92247.1 hypothetical protein GIW2016_39 [Paenibacillus phage GIW2016]UYL92820.1 hypothetical protein ROSALIND_39 [Paenibacillus phage Rosalind]